VDDRSNRQIARERQRAAGDRSAQLAGALMKLGEPALRKLDLEGDDNDGLRDAIDRARAVTSHIARRRAERALAGDLRRYNLVELEAKLAALAEGNNADARELQLAERWRTRLLDEGIAAAAELPGGGGEQLPTLLANARRERTSGKPPGAGRALFRYLVAKLKTTR
jgi:ribosome-associated protein